jgi:chemotaxis protein CheD
MTPARKIGALPAIQGQATGTVFIKVDPGAYVVTRKREQVLVTVLGSCIAACLNDPLAGIGGMNHFMLPSSTHGDWSGAPASARYGNFAMEKLINDILRGGGRRDRLEAKLFGGAAMFGNGTVGERNVQFVRAYLEAEGISIVGSDLCGQHARRVHYEPVSGRAMMRTLPREDQAVQRTEASLAAALARQKVEGDVELFD